MSRKVLRIPKENDANMQETVRSHFSNLFITYCKTRSGDRVSRKTAELIVGILLLKSSWRETFQNAVSATEIQKLMKECYNFLFDANNVSSATIRMQCLFYGKYLTREQFKEHKKEIVLKNSHFLNQKLKKVFHDQSGDFSEMHDDLVRLILIREEMDDKDDQSAFNEMKTAVNCVIPPSELPNFVLNNQKMKTAYINEVSSIAAGMRLHAWYGKKAGKFMFDVAKLMKETLPKVSGDIFEEVSVTKEKLEELQTHLKEDIERLGDEEVLLHKKQLLINITNYYAFIKILKENIDEIATETYRLDYKFAVCVKDANTALKRGPFSKAPNVFPIYKEIGQTWKNLQSEGYLLDFYTNLFAELKESHKHVWKLPEGKKSNVLKFDELQLETPEEKPILVEESSVSNFEKVTLDIKEFCAYYCSLGVLMPSIRDIGIVLYNNSCYGFSSDKAMKYFQKKPFVCTGLAIMYMHVMPELIITLGKEEHFDLPVINTTRQKDVLPVFVSERSVQTILHPTAENIDHEYKWNEWDLRKEAVKYADLVNKTTHSTQTNLSHFRRENFSQAYLPKDNSTQTRRDTGTSMEKTEVSDLQRWVKKSFL